LENVVLDFYNCGKNTGCRPSELLNLQWKDIEFEDITSEAKREENKSERIIAHLFIRSSKTGEQREVPSNTGDALLRWANYQKEYNAKRTKEGITRQTLVFGNPSNEMRAYKYTTYTAAWKQVMQAVAPKLSGHKFSSRQYTIYSMRSTFIENHLLKGLDIFLLARICGHDVKMLMKHYERIDVRKRSREITRIEYGKRKYTKKTIDLFESD
jgi:integrase